MALLGFGKRNSIRFESLPLCTEQSATSMHRVLARKAIVYGLLLICLLISCAVLLSSLRWSASPQPAWTVAWSPNGQVLAVGYGGYGNSGDTLPVDQDTRVRLWNLAQLSQPPISLDARACLTNVSSTRSLSPLKSLGPDSGWRASHSASPPPAIA